MPEKLNPFYNLLKAEVAIILTSDLRETFDSVNKVLSDASELALRQPIPGKQLLLMMDGSIRSAGYALKIEDNPVKKTVKPENVRTRGVWLKNFLPRKTQNVHILKKLLAI